MTDIKVNTRFGELSFDPSKVITFPRGVPGFETCTRWALFHETNEQGEWLSGVVVHLQSLDDGGVSLPLTDPSLFGLNYELQLSNEDVAELKLVDPKDVMVLATLSSRAGSEQGAEGATKEEVFANIAAPIIIGTQSCIGIQKILDGKQAKVDVVIKA